MHTEIYYFSGTGNSLSVAKDIAEKTGGSLIPIASLIHQGKVETDAEVIGIVYPVYYMELPPIIRDFAARLENIQSKYIFAVCTFGGGAGESLKTLKQMIQMRGGKLSATYHVHMPQNAFHKPWEKPPVIFRQWEKKLERLVSNTGKKAEGDYFCNIALNLILSPIRPLFKSLFKKGVARLSDSSPDFEQDALIHLADKSFSANEQCNGCGICVRVCSVANIELSDDRPVWQHRCENCLACYNWCPQKAIVNGVAAEGYYYRHPEVKASDIMKQRESIVEK